MSSSRYERLLTREARKEERVEAQEERKAIYEIEFNNIELPEEEETHNSHAPVMNEREEAKI
jgi:hypothetical protein